MFGIAGAAKFRSKIQRGRRAQQTEDGSLVRMRAGTSKFGIPLRDMLLSLYNIRRSRTAKEAVWFIVFMGLFTLVTYSLFTVHTAFQTNDALIDLFLDEEFEDANYKKNFFEIMTQEEMWTWLQGPLLNGAYPDSWYNGDPLNSEESGYMLHYLRRLGGVQLRQLRVSNNSCRGYQSKPEYSHTGGLCFPPFTRKAESTNAFGPGGAGWTWSEDHHDLSGLFGYGPNYGQGGFSIVLSGNRTKAEKQLGSLFEGKWTDRQTRAVMVMFNVFSPDTGLLTVMRVLFEMFPSGHLVKSFKVYSVRVILYETFVDYLRAIAEILLFVACLTYLTQEAIQAAVLGYKYLLEFGNVYEVVLQVTLFCAVAYWASYIVYDQRRQFTVEASQFIDYYDMGERFIYVFTLLGVVGLLLVLKLFRFFALSKQATALWQTLIRATPDLIAFGIGFCVLICGFAFVATLLYGPTIESFHNLPSAFSSLLRFALGDFDYPELSRARPAVTGWFFALYIASIVLVGMNVLIAIVTMYFEEVNRSLATNDPWKAAVPSLDKMILHGIASATRSARGFCCQICNKPRLEQISLAAEVSTNPNGDRHSLVAISDQPKSAVGFESLLEQALDQAYEFHGEDLFECMDRLYKSASHNQFVVASELARLVNAPPAAAVGDVGESSCRRAMDGCIRVLAGCFGSGFAGRDPKLASKIISAYHRTKSVHLAGAAQPAMLDFYSQIPAEEFVRLAKQATSEQHVEKLELIAAKQPRQADLGDGVAQKRQFEREQHQEFFVFVSGVTGGNAFRVLQVRGMTGTVHSFDRQGKQRGVYRVDQMLQLVEVEVRGNASLEIVVSPAASSTGGESTQSELVVDTGDKTLLFEFIEGKEKRSSFVDNVRAVLNEIMSPKTKTSALAPAALHLPTHDTGLSIEAVGRAVSTAGEGPQASEPSPSWALRASDDASKSSEGGIHSTVQDSSAMTAQTRARSMGNPLSAAVAEQLDSDNE